MEQLNMVLPEGQEESKIAVVTAFESKPESPLLNKVRDKFAIYGGISLIFGLLLALLFYKAGIGVNVFLFVSAIVLMMVMIARKLQVPVKKGTWYYYAGAVLLSASTVLTSSPILHFLNIVGILLLLNLSLLHQFHEDGKWDFITHFFRMIGLAFQSIAAIGMPFVDCVRFMKATRLLKNDKVRNSFLGIVISIPFLWIVVALLANADFLFDSLTRKIFDTVFSSDIIAIGFLIVFGFLACYCVICASTTVSRHEEVYTVKKADASIAATFLSILCLVYGVFCVIQIVYLFADGLFVLPEQFTYAQYARRGFFELLAVAIINVALMVLCRSFFRENRVLKIAVTFMTCCTYIMIASATYRMLLYIDAYYLTFLRVFVLLSLLIIALILTGVIIAQFKKEFPLFRYCVAVVSICYIAFSFSKPDYYIASYLIEHTQRLDTDDVIYLTCELSLDAAPVVLPKLSDGSIYNEIENRYIDGYFSKINSITNDYDIRDFNYAKYLSSQKLNK